MSRPLLVLSSILRFRTFPPSVPSCVAPFFSVFPRQRRGSPLRRERERLFGGGCGERPSGQVSRPLSPGPDSLWGWRLSWLWVWPGSPPFGKPLLRPAARLPPRPAPSSWPVCGFSSPVANPLLLLPPGKAGRLLRATGVSVVSTPFWALAGRLRCGLVFSLPAGGVSPPDGASGRISSLEGAAGAMGGDKSRGRTMAEGSASLADTSSCPEARGSAPPSEDLFLRRRRRLRLTPSSLSPSTATVTVTGRPSSEAPANVAATASLTFSATSTSLPAIPSSWSASPSSLPFFFLRRRRRFFFPPSSPAGSSLSASLSSGASTTTSSR